MRLRIIGSLAAASCIALLSGCAYDDIDGAGYGPGYAPYGGYAGGYYGDGYPGAGAGYYGGYGWYDGFYYPGSGYYIYDRGGHRRPMRDGDRDHWWRHHDGDHGDGRHDGDHNGDHGGDHGDHRPGGSDHPWRGGPPTADAPNTGAYRHWRGDPGSGGPDRAPPPGDPDPHWHGGWQRGTPPPTTGSQPPVGAFTAPSRASGEPRRFAPPPAAPNASAPPPPRPQRDPGRAMPPAHAPRTVEKPD